MVSSFNKQHPSYTPDASRKIEAKEFGLFFNNIKEEFYPAATMVFTPEESGEKLYILS